MITIYLKQYNKIIRNADTGLFEELGYDDILWIDMLQPMYLQRSLSFLSLELFFAWLLPLQQFFAELEH